MSSPRGESGRIGPERAYLAEAISSPFGRQLAIPALFALILFSTGLLFNAATFNPINPQLMDLSAGLAAVFVFWLAGRLKFVERFSNAFLWLIAAVVAAVAPNLAILLINGRFDLNILSQFPIGVVSYSANLFICGLVLVGLRLGVSRSRALRRELQELQASQDKLESQILEMRGEIRSQVQGELSKVSDLLEQASASNRNSFAELIMTAIDEVIRPLSHRLAGFGLTIPESTAKETSFGSSPHRGVALARLAAPELFLSLFALLIGSSAFILSGLNAMAIVLTLAVFESAVLLIVERSAKTFYVHRGLGMFLHATLSAGFAGAYMLLIQDEFSSGIAIGFITVSLAVSGLFALISKRVDTLVSLKLVGAEKVALVSRLAQEVWVTKTLLAKAIHGSVQAKFLAVALRLGSSASLSIENLAQAKLDIRDATDAVNASFEPDQLNLQQHLVAYRDAWEGAVEIDFTIPSLVSALLDSDVIIRACVVETIGEAIANAAKHSKSPRVSVAIMKHNSVIEVSVSSQGALGSAVGKSGYGSQILDQVTNSWSLTQNDGVVTLEAHFQLAK
jgi:hypothetical protein